VDARNAEPLQLHCHRLPPSPIAEYRVLYELALLITMSARQIVLGRLRALQLEKGART
jgi:hypothetical protein